MTTVIKIQLVTKGSEVNTYSKLFIICRFLRDLQCEHLETNGMDVKSQRKLYVALESS